jgi:replicative DNA helicase
MSEKLDEKVLAYALKNKKFTMDLTNSITSMYFKSEFQPIYKIIEKHFTEPKYKEIPTEAVFAEYLQNHYTGDDFIKKSIASFNEIKTLDVVDNEFTWYLDKIKVRYNDQLQRSCAQRVVQLIKTESDSSERIDEVNKLIRETVVNIDGIYKKQAYREGTLSESAAGRAIRYKEIEENPTIAQGIMTGFSEFDRITNGLHKGELMIVAGATGTGKSVVMHNIAVNAYLNKNNPLRPIEDAFRHGANILYFSLEMPKESMERRIDSCMSGVFYNEIRDGTLSLEDKKKYFNVLKFQTQYTKYFHIVDMAKGATPREVELKYLEICETKGKPDLVVIDYIGIMSPNEPGDSDWLALGKVAAELHEFSRVYEVPTVTGSQVNRPKEGKSSYGTDRIARSDTITHNANIIIQIDCRDDEYTRTDMPIFIIKMRDGEKGAFTLGKDFKKMKVIDMATETFNDGDLDDSGI